MCTFKRECVCVCLCVCVDVMTPLKLFNTAGTSEYQRGKERRKGH